MDDDRSRDRNGRKNRRVDLFIASLLCHPNVEEAAAAARISTASGWRYLRDPEVLTRLRAACRDTMQQSKSLLQAASIEAVSLLRKILREGESESVQVGAAKTILEMALRAVELDDIGERLARLERLAKNNWRPDDHEPGNTQAGNTRNANGRAQ
jgi:hypothetical protein